MDLLSSGQVSGHRIELLATDPRHIRSFDKAGASARQASATDAEEGFGRLFMQSLSRVNDLQVRAQDLSRALITDPDSVDVHDVTVALAEANLALSMTKAVVDRAIRAYREIVNIR